MKKLLILLIASIILLAGCKTQFNQPAAAPLTSTQSTIASTSTIKVEDCPPQFLRSYTKADGSIEKYCLPPDYFRLKPCSSQSDCMEFEECFDGYCKILYED